ncbi:hypothetical protein [Actinocrispum sp. NPDC049592]|uniref:hypothetical protein n=1 Tax=Actinocrispum sp. NPDC049592 TaxID=3154835 RepID=UPI0034260A70
MKRLLVVLAALSFLAAGTFGTLWFIEHGHRTTAARQLDETNAAVGDAKARLTAAEAHAMREAISFKDKSLIERRQQEVLDHC